MKILTRYVLREFVVPLGYCLTGLLSIYVLFDLFGSFSRISDSGLSIGAIVLYFAAYLAPYFHYLAPASLMLATLYTMWMFCRHSEIVAMRASGISFMSIVKPLLAVAFVMALVVVGVNEWFVPRFSPWADQLKTERFNLSKMEKTENFVYRNSKHNRTWCVNRIEGAHGHELKGVKVSEDREGGVRKFTVSADRVEYLDGEWWFHDPKIQHFDALGNEIATPAPELDALKFRCFPGFDESPSDFIMQNRPWKYNSTMDRLRYLNSHPKLDAERQNDLKYDLWAQIMAPWACLIITLFAIPAGIASGRQSVFRGIVTALGLYFAFYALTIGGMVVARCGFCPSFLAAVLPPVVFLGLGIRAFYRQR